MHLYSCVVFVWFLFLGGGGAHFCVFHSSDVFCVYICVDAYTSEHAFCTLTTSLSMCWGVMDTAVACPLKNNLHPFAWELIRGREGRFDSYSRTIWWCEHKGIQKVSY